MNLFGIKINVVDFYYNINNPIKKKKKYITEKILLILFVIYIFYSIIGYTNKIVEGEVFYEKEKLTYLWKENKNSRIYNNCFKFGDYSDTQNGAALLNIQYHFDRYIANKNNKCYSGTNIIKYLNETV